MIAYICDKCGKFLNGGYYRVASNYISDEDRGSIERVIDCIEESNEQYRWHLCDKCMKEIAKQCNAVGLLLCGEEVETEEEGEDK